MSTEDVEAFRLSACEAALRLFERQTEVSLRQLATELGCSAATPYRYFESKEELFAAARALSFQRFAAHVRRALLGHEDPVERLFVLGRTYADYAHTHPAQIRLMFQLGQPAPDRFPVTHKAGTDAWAIVRETAEAAVQCGALAGDPDELAHLLWASVHGVVSLSLSHRLQMGRSCEDLVDAIIAALCRAHTPETKA